MPLHILEDKPKKFIQRKYPIVFYNDPTYYWASKSHLKLLTKQVIDDFFKHDLRKQDPDLINAYQEASKYPTLTHYLNLINKQSDNDIDNNIDNEILPLPDPDDGFNNFGETESNTNDSPHFENIISKNSGNSHPSTRIDKINQNSTSTSLISQNYNAMQLLQIEKETEIENNTWIPLVGSRVLCEVEGYPASPGMVC